MCAMTDPQVCVDLVFWKEHLTNFLVLLPKESFFAMLGILSIRLFYWVKSTALWTLSKSCLLLKTIISMNRKLRTKKDSPRIGSWSRIRPVFVPILQCLPLLECDISNWVENMSCHRVGQYSNLYHNFLLCVKKWKDCFLNKLHRNWVWLVTLWLPSGCWTVFGKTEAERQCYSFCTNLIKKHHVTLSRKQRIPSNEKITCNDLKRNHDESMIKKSVQK